MTDERELVERRSVTMRPSHWATVEAYARQVDDDSVSKSLRRIIDEWVQFKSTQLPLPMPNPAEMTQ